MAKVLALLDRWPNPFPTPPSAAVLKRCGLYAVGNRWIRRLWRGEGFQSPFPSIRLPLHNGAVSKESRWGGCNKDRIWHAPSLMDPPLPTASPPPFLFPPPFDPSSPLSFPYLLRWVRGNLLLSGEHSQLLWQRSPNGRRAAVPSAAI